jgi:peptidoglycan hydrolase FlgJ
MQTGALDRVGMVGRAEDAPSLKLVQTAQEFEGLMMKELLKPMTNGGLLGDEDSDAGSEGALGEFASEALGQALSRHGGLGIADRIVRDLTGPRTRQDIER